MMDIHNKKFNKLPLVGGGGGERGEAMCKRKDFIGREKGKYKTVLWINSILDVLIRKSVTL